MKKIFAETDEVIARIRESALFYLKLDFGFIAGLATLVSVTKIDPDQLLSSAANFKNIILFLICLILFALVIEFVTTDIRNSISIENKIKENHLPLIRKAVNFLYIVQFLAHIFLFGVFSGFLSSYLGHLSNV